MGPKGVAVDRNGHIIVVDNKSCCVFTFQPNGKLVGRFGGRGATDRHFAGTGGELGDPVLIPQAQSAPWGAPALKTPPPVFGPQGLPLLCTLAPSSQRPHPSSDAPPLSPRALFPAPLHVPAHCQRPPLYFQGPISWP